MRETVKDISIGQFFPGSSVIHGLDPRIKLALTFFYIILIFSCRNFFSLVLSVLLLLAASALSRIPVKVFFKGLKPVFIVIIFTALLNVFYIDGGRELLKWHFIRITTVGIYTSLFMVIRIVCLVTASSLLTYTTSPTMITDAIERLLSPFKFLRSSVHTVTMMMTIALRFIPTLIDEFDRITSAQKARGADLETGTLPQRAKALIPVFIPLFINSFRRAYELAFAMECRCYRGGEGRTRMKSMSCGRKDYAALAIFISATVAALLLNFKFTALI